MFLSMLLLFSLTACGGSVAEGTDFAGIPDGTDTAASPSTEEKETKRSAQEILEASEHLVGLCDQGNSRIIVADLAEEDWENDSAVVWQYKDPTCRSVAGLKLRWSEQFQELVVIYCWHGGAAIISYETKEVLYKTTQTGSNPHSVELLPEGHLVVASSTDNDVRIYSAQSIAKGDPRCSQQVEFPNAHGVLWDPEYDVLWMFGMDQLSAYLVAEEDGIPRMTAIGGMSYKAPKSGGHDLCPVYGNKDALFITCGGGILMFDKQAEKFTTSYPGGSVGKKHGYAPGTGNFAQDNVLFFTSISDRTKVLNDWCTNIVFVYVPKADGIGKTIRRKAPDDAYYKVRAWLPDYQ